MKASNALKLFAGSSGTEQKHIVQISFLILIAVALIVCVQKFMRYHHLPEYNLFISIFFNFATIVPFTGAIFLSMKLPRILRGFLQYRPLIIAVSGIMLFAGYILSVNLVLYILDLTNALLLSAFVSKYFSGIIQAHLVLYLFVQIYVYRRCQEETPDGLTLRKNRNTYHLPFESVFWIESYGHYLKIHTEKGLFLKRGTMNGILESLDHTFLRIHRKYIVNSSHVDHILREDGKVRLAVRGQLLRVSDSYKDVLNRLFRFRE